MSNAFFGIADYLSLWVQRHGFGTDDIVTGEVCWCGGNILTFRVTRKGRRSPISPVQYDTRLPEHPLALAYRPRRVRMFLWKAYAFRRVMARVDGHIRSWAWDWQVDLMKLQVAPRWASSGHVVLKLVPQWAAMNPRRYMSHYKYDA